MLCMQCTVHNVMYTVHCYVNNAKSTGSRVFKLLCSVISAQGAVYGVKGTVLCTQYTVPGL